MKFLGVVFLTFFLSFNLFAQDTSRTSIPEPSPVEPPKGPILTSHPTAIELADLFTNGEISQAESIDRAVEKGDNAVAGLTALLFSETVRGPKRQPSDTGGFVPNKVAIVRALEGIGTEQSFAALIQAANSHNTTEVSGVALNALNITYYPKVQQGSLVPDKNIIEALIRNLGDETYLGSMQKPVSQIAQKGLVRWLGLDFGDPQFEEARIIAAGGKYKQWDPEKENKREPQLSAAAYGKRWWKENKEKLSWNGEKGHFEVVKLKP